MKKKRKQWKPKRLTLAWFHKKKRKMWFLKLVTQSVVLGVTVKTSQVVGNAVYEMGKDLWDYYWAHAEDGYFKDHPEDKNKENTPGNLVRRVKKCCSGK